MEHRMLLAGVFLVCLYYWIKWMKNHFCFRHWKFRNVQFLPVEYDDTKNCPECLHDQEDPKVFCMNCHWRGRFSELDDYSFNDDMNYRYFCPKCECEYEQD